MKFYVTIEGISKLKRSFLNLKLFYVINVPEILESFGYTYSTIDDYSSFIVSKKINNLIKTYSRSKRIRGIIYSNPSLNENLIPNLFNTLENNDYINEVVLMDNADVPKLRYLYEYFDEVIFFPAVRKIRIIEAKPILNIDETQIDSKDE